MRCTVRTWTRMVVRMESAVCDAAVSGLLWRWLGSAGKCGGCGSAVTLNLTSSLAVRDPSSQEHPPRQMNQIPGCSLYLKLLMEVLNPVSGK